MPPVSTHYQLCSMVMNPNYGETAVRGCHCQGDIAVRMREVLVRLRSCGAGSVCLLSSYNLAAQQKIHDFVWLEEKIVYKKKKLKNLPNRIFCKRKKRIVLSGFCTNYKTVFLMFFVFVFNDEKLRLSDISNIKIICV